MADDPEPRQPPEEPDPRTTVVMLAVVVEGGLILLAWLAGWLAGSLPLETFFWSLSDAALGVAATLPMLAVFFACLRWPVGPLRKIKALTDEIVRPLLAPCTLLDLAGIAVLAGLGEEMLFRGVLQASFVRWTGRLWLGLALASVLFGVLHAVTLSYAVFATVMGAYLGWLWQRSENLLTVAVAHALYDFVALVVILRGGPADQPNNSSTL
jgi:membrane protease YdiL (CAAX protease family)